MKQVAHEDAALVAAVVGTMEQGARLLGELSRAQYTARAPELGLNAIGAHYRHHLDHLTALLKGLSIGQIDYDARERGTAVEHDPEVALRLTRQALESLVQCVPGRLDEPLTVLQRSCADHERPRVASTVRRELLFLQSHAVHHYAIIAILARRHGVALPEDFGVMPSTLAWMARSELGAHPATTPG